MDDQVETGVKYFLPGWFLALFRGELTFGDTFWAGSIGAQLLFVPFWMFTAMFAKIIGPQVMIYVLLVMGGFYALYYVLLLRAVVVTALRNKTAGGWRWAGIFLVFAEALVAVLFVFATVEDFITAV